MGRTVGSDPWDHSKEPIKALGGLVFLILAQ